MTAQQIERKEVPVWIFYRSDLRRWRGRLIRATYHETTGIKRYKACNIKHMTFFSPKVKKELIFRRQFDKDALFFPDMKNETAG
jgi:hypothetical protein